MQISKLTKRVLLISFTLFISACAGASAQPTTTPINPTAAIVISTATMVVPTDTVTSAPSPTPIPTLTATPAPFAVQSKIEFVTGSAATGDGGNPWGGHQTRIVHTQDGIFTAYTVGTDYFNREWRLAERQPDGTWKDIATGNAGREPVNLLASPDGTLNIVGWPSGYATLWAGKPENGSVVMKESRIPMQLAGYWPYNSAGIYANGELCVVSSEGGEQPGGRFYISCYLPISKTWKTLTINTDYRFCYTYVFPGIGGDFSLVSNRDVRWSALGYQQPAGSFDYVFNAFGLWHTGDFLKDPLNRVFSIEQKPENLGDYVYLDAQQDAYADISGIIHIIYAIQDKGPAGTTNINRQAILSPDGKVLEDIMLPGGVGDFSRIFQDQEGDFFLLSSSGWLFPMGKDGSDPGFPIQLDLGGNQVEYSGFGVSVPRTGTPLSDVMDVVFPSGNGAKWIYFQLNFGQ